MIWHCCSGRHEEETGGDRWGHISREPAQLPVRHTPPVQEAAEPAVHTDRPKFTLAPRSEEPAPEQPVPAPVKKVTSGLGSFTSPVKVHCKDCRDRGHFMDMENGAPDLSLNDQYDLYDNSH